MTIIEKLVYLMEQTGETRTAVSEATGIPLHHNSEHICSQLIRSTDFYSDQTL